MHKCCFLLVTSILAVSSRGFKPNSNNDDLIKFIDLLNNRYDDDDYGTSKYLQTLTDTEVQRSNENVEMTEMMRLLQKNYDAREEMDVDNGERLYYIRNPEIIDQYNHIKKRLSHEIQHSDVDAEETLKELLHNLRRSAVFRLKKDKEVNNPAILRVGSDIGKFDSIDPKRARGVRVDTKKQSWYDSLEREKRVMPKLRMAEDKYKLKERGVSFGRTSIPFSGKRSVFDDNYN